jgi:cyclophilin family peptidyl-prolyl cis-trans isomerase/HEAT repeat protein
VAALRAGAVVLLACGTATGCLPAVAPSAGAPVTAADTEALREDARLLAMFDQRTADTVLVDRLLAGPVAARRARAALVVGQNAVRARYPALRRLLVDADTAVAASAAFALGLGKDTASVVALGRAFAGAPDAVAREAAWALGEIGDPARAIVTIALGEGLGQPRVSSTAAQRSPEVRAELLLAATKMRTVPIAAITPWAADSVDVVTRAVSYALGRQRLPAGVRTLLSLAAHGDEFVRQQVARALVRESAGDSLAARARATLQILLTDPSPRVRANAARSVGTFGPSSRTDFQRAMRDPDANVRVAVAENAGAVLVRDAAEWQRAWDADTTYMVRRTLLAAARREGTDALAAGEVTWAGSPDWRLRVAAIEARAAATANDRLALARAALTDVDDRVRSAALSLLPAAASDTGTRSIARRMLADPHFSVRSTASGMLARGANAAELPLVLDAYERALPDSVDDARAAALRYVAAAWTRDSAAISGELQQRLGALPVPTDAGLRAIVADVTPMGLWRAVPPRVARPLGEYERIVHRWLVPGAAMPTAVIRTERGDITLALLAADAPLVVEAFIALAEKGYYRESRFHRVVPNFVAQDGDPRGNGSGGPGFTLRDAYSRQRHERGCLGLATAGPDTGSAQYYLCHSAQPHLDGHYTVFGRVLRGFEVLDAIVQGDRVISVDIR